MWKDGERRPRRRLSGRFILVAADGKGHRERILRRGALHG